MLEAEQKARTPSSKSDCSDPATQGLIIKMAEDYFSLVPRDLWATVEGRPIIAVYYLNERSVINGLDLATRNAFMQRLSQQFHATHGVDPYLIADRLWDSNQSMSLAVDEYFSWGASACFACTNAASGFGQPSVFEV